MIKMKAFSVTEITQYLKRILSGDPILRHLIVEGEISNFVKHSSGHAYFSVKDAGGKLACVMFNCHLDWVPKNGDLVQIEGSIGLYEKEGRYQFYVDKIEQVGLGKLYLQFEALKAKMKEEGLFDPLHKKAIPPFPKRIGVITSPTGAALQDILSVAKRRSNYSDLLIFPVRVQGEYAAGEVAGAIAYFNKKNPVDLILIARGGGSIEELWAFNEPEVAYAIFHSDCPVITGVGHETDFTISDFVADLRAPTPSAAAEMAIKTKQEIERMLNQTLQRMIMMTRREMALQQAHLRRTNEEALAFRLRNGLKNHRTQLEQIEKAMTLRVKHHLETDRLKLETAGSALSALSPLGVLDRGYAVVEKAGHMVRSVDQLETADTVNVRFSDGEAQMTVASVEKNRRQVQNGNKKTKL